MWLLRVSAAPNHSPHNNAKILPADSPWRECRWWSSGSSRQSRRRGRQTLARSPPSVCGRVRTAWERTLVETWASLTNLFKSPAEGLQTCDITILEPHRTSTWPLILYVHIGAVWTFAFLDYPPTCTANFQIKKTFDTAHFWTRKVGLGTIFSLKKLCEFKSAIWK